MFHYQLYNFHLFLLILWNNIYIKSFFLFSFGIIMGSFATMLIYRLPIILKDSFKNSCIIFLNLNEKPKKILNIYSKSSCPNCNKRIPFRYNIPLIGFIFLKGQCYYCNQKISIKYFLIELWFGISFFLVSICNFNFIQICIVISLIFILTISSIIDYYEKFLINELVYIIMFIGFLLSNKLNTNLNLHYSIIIFLINYIFLNFISKIIEHLTKKETILGAGDILLISTLCEFLIPNTIFIFYIIIGLFGIIYLLINNKHIIPLVPVISLSFLVVNLI